MVQCCRIVVNDVLPSYILYNINFVPDFFYLHMLEQDLACRITGPQTNPTFKPLMQEHAQLSDVSYQYTTSMGKGMIECMHHPPPA